MFENFPKSELKIVSPEGTIRSVENGLVDSKQIIIPNKKAVIYAGDEIRRKLPNGTEEAFEVVDPVYFDGLHGAIPAHFQVKIRRKGAFPAGKGGNFTFNVSGPNARVNIGSQDHSQNIAAGNSVFVELREKVQSTLTDPEERSHLLSLIENMEKSVDNRSAFATAYQNFISSAANHMTLIAPFLLAITNFLS
jgi:hypothetical protein